MEDIGFLDDLRNLQNIERRKRLPYRNKEDNDFYVLDERDFKYKYRLSKHVVSELVNILDEKIRPNSDRNCSLSSLEKILITLRFYATGAFQSLIGDVCEVSQPSVCRSIVEASKAIAELRSEYVKLPCNEAERQEVSREFYNLTRFPGVIGALDCSHIPILNPGGTSSERFRCRKGFFSLNVQTLTDTSLKIRDIVACWPGSAHDSTIFDNSHLRAVLETEVPPYYHVIGDNGYGCRSYLLTPFLNPISNGQKRYTASHVLARNTVERSYGLWKRRFPCLDFPLRCSIENAMVIIVATAVVHNIAISMNDDFGDDFGDFHYNANSGSSHRHSVLNQPAGIAKRNAIVNSFFS